MILRIAALSSLLLWVLFPTAAQAQGAPSTVAIVAPKTSFIFGEIMKLAVFVRGAAGVQIQQPSVSWFVEPPQAAKISADGTLTPILLETIVVRAQSGNARGEIALQILPKRIVLRPQRNVMTVGATQLIRADATDFADQPIPGVIFRWSLTNLLRAWDNNNPMATVDGLGQMRALVQGTVLVTAAIEYPTFPSFLTQIRGETLVEMRAVKAYEFDRVLTAEPKTGSSRLMPRAAQLLPIEDDGFAFAASIDSTGLALLKWRNGTLQSLLSSGRNHSQTGQPLVDFMGYATNHNGEMLTQEVDTIGQIQISNGPPQSQTPLLVPGTPLNVADRTTRFDVQRNSLADNGLKLILGYYNEVDTLRSAIGLFRGEGKGLSEKIVSTLDSLPGYPGEPFSFRYYGIAADGAAWFSTNIGTGQAKLVLWKQKPYEPIERVLGDSDAFQGSTVRNIANSGGATTQTLFVASNGEVVTTVDTANSAYFVRWSQGDPNPQVLRGATSDIYWHEPGVGSLIQTNQNNRGNGLYLWTPAAEVRPLLLIGSQLDGSAITEIQSAASNRQGVVFAMVATADNPMLIVRVEPDPQVLLRSEDIVPIAVPPVIPSFVRVRGGQGQPFVVIGGQSGTIAQVAMDGTLQPVIAFGDALPNGRVFRGSNATQVRVLPNGDIVFADSNGIHRWSNGSITLIQQYPINVAGSSLGTPSAIDVNSRGDLAGQFFAGTGTGIYVIAGGVATKIVRLGDLVNGEVVTAVRQPAIDDSGRVAVFAATARTEYLVLWRQGTLSVILTDGTASPDGRTIRTHSQTVLASSDSFTGQITLTDGQTTYIRYRSNAWELIAGRTDRMPNGSYMLFGNLFAVNRSSDIAFFYNGGAFINHLVAKRAQAFQQVQDFGELTENGDLLLGLTSLIMNDDGSIFALATNDDGKQVIYRGNPINGVIEVPFTVRAIGGVSMTTSGGAPSALAVGYGRLESTATLSGMAIFGNRQNGVLVSEAAVPDSPAISTGRIYAEVAGPVNTGLAIANPNDQAATVSFTFMRSDGADAGSGAFTLDSNKQIAAFLNQAPFNGGSNFTGTLSFTSSIPVSVIALRGYVNSRQEFLITTLPVTNLLQPPSTSTVTLPHFAAGGGWTTQIVLVNPTGSALSGSVQFYSGATGMTPGAPVAILVGGSANSVVAYNIPAKASVKLVVTDNGPATISGSVRVVAGNGQSVPSSLAVFSLTSGNTVVTEAGVTGVAGTVMQMYAETSGLPFNVGSIQTGVAIANPSSQPVTVNLDIRRLDGSGVGVQPLSLSIPPNGQIGKFLFELFPSLAPPFQGVLRIAADTPVSVTGLRGRTNERGEFLITTTAPSLPATGLSTSGLFFPHLVNGGGYTTQIIIVGNGLGDFPGTVQFFSQSGEPLPLPLR